jgi:hypothetical protein
VIEIYGLDFYKDAIAHLRHYHDDAGRPYWHAADWEDIEGLIGFEQEDLELRLQEHERDNP